MKTTLTMLALLQVGTILAPTVASAQSFAPLLQPFVLLVGDDDDDDDDDADRRRSRPLALDGRSDRDGERRWGSDRTWSRDDDDNNRDRRGGYRSGRDDDDNDDD